MNRTDECCNKASMDESRTGIGTAPRGEEPVPGNIPYTADARIKAVENGFIAEVGCKTFVSQDWEELAAALGEYWKDPQKAEAKFSKKR